MIYVIVFTKCHVPNILQSYREFVHFVTFFAELDSISLIRLLNLSGYGNRVFVNIFCQGRIFIKFTLLYRI